MVSKLEINEMFLFSPSSLVAPLNPKFQNKLKSHEIGNTVGNLGNRNFL